jgi:hypothetical protein
MYREGRAPFTSVFAIKLLGRLYEARLQQALVRVQAKHFALDSESLSRRRGRGNVEIPRVGSRLYGFPCFPYSVISVAFPEAGSEFEVAANAVNEMVRRLIFP